MALYVHNEKTDKTENKQVTTIYHGKDVVTAVYRGLRLIWQYIKSCFGRGYWINDKTWSETDGWAN